MRTYSIKELENLSGTKAHTIRIWEQRYELLHPSRTETGIRFYNGDDLKKILATSVLLKHGMKISKIATLTASELNTQLDEIEKKNVLSDSAIELAINNLLMAGLKFDENALNAEFTKLESAFDRYQLFTLITHPLLNRLGLMWCKDDLSPLQEHFISNIIRQKIISSINALPENEENSKEIVLFLPEHETHEIGLLLANYIFKSFQIKTIYFGQQVPMSNLIEYINEFKIKHAFGFIFYSYGIKELTNIFKNLSDNCGETYFYWAGYFPDQEIFDSIPNQSIVSSIDSIKDLVNSIKND